MKIENFYTQDDTLSRAMSRILGLFVLWLGTVKLADIQVLISIFSGLAVCAYSVLKCVALWRHEFNFGKLDDDDK